MQWHLKVQSPSGERRFIAMSDTMVFGRDLECDIPLRDPEVAPRAGVLWMKPDDSHSDFGRGISSPVPARSPFWIRIDPEHTRPARVGDIEVREANLPSRVPIRIGDSTLTLEPKREALPLPSFPNGARPWLTCTESGRKVVWLCKKAATTPLSIYIAGETGTGKEVIAHLIHAWSDRASGPFVPLHCGALTASLIESELFGHVKGAYTGAHAHRRGALMQAHGGTLFLDEVGDLPIDMQVKLLRFLENGEIRAVGSDQSARADVRLLCATHLPLAKLVQEGKFRQDLFFRLASVTVEIPTLRDRPDDVEMLASRFSSDLGKSISPRAMVRLQSYGWPGNVRELRHAIERSAGLAGPLTSVLDEEAFDFLIGASSVAAQSGTDLPIPAMRLKDMERYLLLRALRLSDGNRSDAAKLLGVARSTVFEMIKRHKLKNQPRKIFDPTSL